MNQASFGQDEGCEDRIGLIELDIDLDDSVISSPFLSNSRAISSSMGTSPGDLSKPILRLIRSWPLEIFMPSAPTRIGRSSAFLQTMPMWSSVGASGKTPSVGSAP